MALRRERNAPARIFAAIALWIAVSIPAVARAVVLQRGDLLIADHSQRLVVVSPATGTQTLLSYNPGFVPVDVAVGPRGVLYALGHRAATGFAVVVRVDPASGAQTAVYEAGRATGARHFAVGPNGRIYLPDLGSSLLMCLDPETGSAVPVLTVKAKDLAVDRAGLVWIIQDRPGAHILWVANLCGASATGGPLPPLEFPLGLSPSALSIDPGGRLYVLVDRSVFTIAPDTYEWSRHSELTDSTFPLDLAAVSSQATYVLSERQPVQHRGRVGVVRRYERGGTTGALITEADLLDFGLGIAVYDPAEVATPAIRGTWGRIKAHY